jgi:glutaredoxin 3
MTDRPTITVYRTRGCPFCIMAADLLGRLDAEVDEVFLDDHPDRGQVTSKILPGHHTVPLVVVGEQPIGGFDELRQLQAAGRLEGLLRGEGG